jgi:chemotaxis signal transduction protein
MPATCSAQLTLARIRIGEVGIGIRIETVLQALPLPETFSRLPLRTHALLGMVEHDGMAVPVVDLARWLDVGSRLVRRCSACITATIRTTCSTAPHQAGTAYF